MNSSFINNNNKKKATTTAALVGIAVVIGAATVFAMSMAQTAQAIPQQQGDAIADRIEALADRLERLGLTQQAAQLRAIADQIRDDEPPCTAC